MISLEELNPKEHPLKEDEKAHLSHLHYALNFLRALYGHPLLINRAYSTADEQIEIYAKKGVPKEKVPMGSLHLLGAAADVSDPRGEFQRWLLEHLHIAESLNLYFEDFAATPTWTHIQIYPPLSGSRFFKP